MNKREFLNMIVSGAVAAPVAALVAGKKQAPVNQNISESVYDRVMRTGVIRCGYLVYAPNFMIDVNTGKKSGIFYDLMEQLGKNLGFKIEWVEEGSTISLSEALNNDRIDIVGSGLWPSASRARVVDFSQPVFYHTLGLFVRNDDHRFDQDIANLNNPKHKIAVIEGEMADRIQDVDFPKAGELVLPQMTDLSILLLNVATKKADATIAAVNEAIAYNETNGNVLREVKTSKPLRTFPNVLFWKKGETKFSSMMNSALDEMFYAGKVSDIIDRYETYPGSFLRVTKPDELN